MNNAIRNQHAEIINAVAEDRMDFDTFYPEVLNLTITFLVDEDILTEADLVDGESTPEADEIVSRTMQSLAEGMMKQIAARREVLAA